MRALYLFDAMISGVEQWEFKKECDETNYELISNLMSWTLNGDDIGHSETDWFIKNEWNLFLQKKKSIKLELDLINEYYHSLSELVVFKAVENKKEETVNGKDNVLKPEWLSLFPSVDTVIISTQG